MYCWSLQYCFSLANCVPPAPKKAQSDMKTVIYILLFLLSVVATTAKKMEFEAESLDGHYKGGYRYISRSSDLSFEEAMTTIKHDPSAFMDILQSSKLPDAYFFECPPVTKSTAKTTPFEFVILPAPSLENIEPDADAFSEHFDSSSKLYAVFPSLGKDAMLIAPIPEKGESNDVYTHLATFVRHAPHDQVTSLLRASAEQVLSSLSGDKLWLSTSGLGVSWLHLRLDSRPKYYNYVDYKHA